MPEIIVTLGGNEVARYTFEEEEISIGRAEGNDVRVNNLSVSRKHAQIRREDGHYYLVDLESANGTFLNGTRVARSEIFNNDKIGVGKHLVHFLVSDVPKAAEYASIERTIVLDKSAAGPFLRVHSTNHRDTRLPLSGKTTRIGRAKDNDLRLVDWFVEMHQAQIEKEGHLYRLRDISSRQSTMVNDQLVQDAYLNEGDIIQAGVSRMVFSLQSAGSAVSAPAAERAPAPEAKHTGAPDPIQISMEPPEEELRIVGSGEEAPSEKEEDFEARFEGRDEEEPPESEIVEELAPLPEVAAAPQPDLEPLEADLLEEPVFPAFSEQDMVSEARAEGFEEDLEADLLDAEELETEEEISAPVGDQAQWDDMAARVPAEDEAPGAPSTTAEMEMVAGPEVAEAFVAAEPEEDADAAEPVSEANRKAVAMWEKALQNKSAFVRKQAAAQLKRLTGRDYDI